MILSPLSEEDHKAIFMSFKFNKGKEPIKRETPSYYVCAACRGEEKFQLFQGTLPDIDDPNFNEEYPHGVWTGDSFRSIWMEAFEESFPLLRYVEYVSEGICKSPCSHFDNPTIKNHVNLRTIKFRELTGENPYFQLKPANKAQLARKRKEVDDNLKKLQLKEMSSEYDYDEWGDDEFDRSRKRRRR